MAHDHHHHNDDSYYTDQLCMVGLSGAFGVICLCLFFVQRAMLVILLGPQFHLFVMLSGFALLALALVRAATLWREAKPSTALASLPVVPAHRHDHEHAHEHPHEHHAGCDHDDNGHHQDHEHGHDHSHNHDDHDHGWAPWRYVVMLVPIILFMLGLPNKPPAAAAYKVDDDTRIAEAVRESSQVASLIGLDEWSRVAAFCKTAGDNALGDAMPVDFKRLHDSPDDKNEQVVLQDKIVKIRGQFAADPSDPRFFTLVRSQIGCCGADAVQKKIRVFSRQPITEIKHDEWAEVVGKVEYGKRGAATVVRLVTLGPATVHRCNQDPHPYFQP